MNRRNETNSQTTFAQTAEKSSAVGNAAAMRELEVALRHNLIVIVEGQE